MSILRHLSPSILIFKTSILLFTFSVVFVVWQEFRLSFSTNGESYLQVVQSFKSRFGDLTKLVQCFYIDLAGLWELANTLDISIAADCANLDEIKTIILGLQLSNSINAELIQGCILQKILQPRIRNAFVHLSTSFSKLIFDFDAVLEVIKIEIYIDEVTDLHAVSINKDNTNAMLSSRA